MKVKYPLNGSCENMENPAIRIYGNRFHNDQSLYEYLIEFLLVFSSAKAPDGTGEMSFHSDEPLYYFVKPRNGLRRFIFFEQAKRVKKIPGDESANDDIKRILLKHIEADKESEKEEFLQAIQDLFRGYAAVLKNRSWCAQALLPLCPEMIFCEEMPNDNYRLRWEKGSEADKAAFRKRYSEKVAAGYSVEDTFLDDSFDLTRHNFLARGGEVYYLHLLQVLKDAPEAKERLQSLLVNLLTDKSSDFSQLANWIQGTWEKEKKLDPDHLVTKMNIGCIPAGAYLKSGKLAVEELTCFLSNELHPVKRVELLAKGIMLQIMRMQVEQTEEYLSRGRLPWIIDMRSAGNKTVKKLSSQSFTRISEAIMSVINQEIINNRDPHKEGYDLTEEYKLFVKARKESLDIFKSKGKEIQCVIPLNGPDERFSISEDVLKFLVLSLVPAGGKMDLDSFLSKLYDHYSFVIGPDEYKHCQMTDELDNGLTDSFTSNKAAFQKFLKDAGFLRDLSDATSIVVNPYKGVEIE